MVMPPCSDCHVDSPSIVQLSPSPYRRARIRFRFVVGISTGQIACLTTCGVIPRRPRCVGEYRFGGHEERTVDESDRH